MEPGTSREIATGVGCPRPAGVREETPGKEAGGAGDGAGMLKRRGADAGTAEEADAYAYWGDDGAAETQTKTGEGEDAGKYEEELDPRIQACFKMIIIT